MGRASTPLPQSGTVVTEGIWLCYVDSAMGSLRAHPRFAVALGIGALVVLGVVVSAIFISAGGSGDSAVATTGAYAPITVSRPKLHLVAGSVVADPEAGVQNNLTTSVFHRPGSNDYRITVTNSSNIGFIDSFQWYPPYGVRIVKVTGSSVGRCAIDGVSGFGGNQFQTVLLYPNILCDKVGLKPPSCTCQGDGGSVDISFVSDRPMGATGTARLVSAQLVLRPIPSYLSSPSVPSNVPVGSGG